MPGQFQFSVDLAVQEAEECGRLGIPALILFGIPSKKDDMGSEAYAKDGIIQRAVREIKSKVPKMVVATDLCFCEYTSHGHCGVLRAGKKQGARSKKSKTSRFSHLASSWILDNDATLDLIARTAVSQARAGA